MNTKSKVLLIIAGLTSGFMYVAYTEETIVHRMINRGKAELADIKDSIREHPKTINAQDNKGNTVLHLAAKKPSQKNAEIVQFLLKQEGIKKDIKNNSEKTALELAQEYFIEPSYFDIEYWEGKGIDYDRWGPSLGRKKFDEVRNKSKKREEEEKKAKQDIVYALTS